MILNIIKLIVLIIGLLGSSFIAACTQQDKQPHAKAPRKVMVSAVTVHSAKVPVTYSYAGLITSANETKIIPQISGILLHSNFQAGSFVTKDTSLFTIDSTEYAAQLQQAAAKKELAEIEYKQAIKSSNRAKILLKQQILSASMAETVFNKSAEALSNLKQAQASYETAKLNLERCNIKAPISGAMGRALMPDGSLVTAGSSVLAVLTQLDKLYFDFSPSSKDFLDIKRSLAQQGVKNNNLYMKIYSNKAKNQFINAKLDFTSPSIDQATDTINARAILNNNGIFIPGEFVRAKLEGVSEYGISIPEEALVQDGSGTYVYVISEQKLNPTAPSQLLAIRTNVEVLKQLENRNWLIKISPTENEGLQDGDKILTKGLFMVEGAMAAIKGKMPGVPVVLTNLDGSEI